MIFKPSNIVIHMWTSYITSDLENNLLSMLKATFSFKQSEVFCSVL